MLSDPGQIRRVLGVLLGSRGVEPNPVGLMRVYVSAAQRFEIWCLSLLPCSQSKLAGGLVFIPSAIPWCRVLGFRDYLCLEVAHGSQETRTLVLRHIPAPVRIHGVEQGMSLDQFRESEPSRYAKGGRGANVVGGVEEVLVVPVGANLRRFRV
jgi:hypothetical protein